MRVPAARRADSSASSAARVYHSAPPVLGQDNLELLRELGYTDRQLDDLKNKKVI